MKLVGKCQDCINEPTNSNSVCNHVGPFSHDYVYEGILSCSGVEPGDSVTVAIQKIEEFMCGPGLTGYILTLIQNNPSQFTDFITLILEVVSCKVIDNCGPPPTTTTTSSSTTSTTTTITPTTTTTTTACPDVNLVVNGNFATDLSGWTNYLTEWSWTPSGAYFGGVDNFSNLLYQNILIPGETYDVSFTMTNNYYCPEYVYINVCSPDTMAGPFTATGTYTVNLIMTATGSGMFAFNGYDACGNPTPTNDLYIHDVYVSQHCSGFTTTSTTTTVAPTTSTTTSTSTSSTTTTSTTAAPTTSTTSTSSTSTTSSTTTTTTTAAPGSLTLQNNTGGIIEDVYATAWYVAIATPCGPSTTMVGAHAATTFPVNVGITSSPGIERCLRIYRNGILMGQIDVNGDGVYTFPAFTISNSNAILITFNSGVCFL